MKVMGRHCAIDPLFLSVKNLDPQVYDKKKVEFRAPIFMLAELRPGE